MKKMNIKSLLTINKEYLVERLTRGGTLVFDDGTEAQFNKNEIVFTRFLLDPIVRMELVEELPLTNKFNIQNYYTNGMYTGKTINTIVEKTVETLVNDFIKPRRGKDLIPDNYEFDKRVIDYFIDNVKVDKNSTPSKEILVLYYKYAYETINSIYNDIVFENLQYTTGLDIDDLLDIQFEPELLEAMQEVLKNGTMEAVNHTYDVLDDVMKKEKFKNNPIAVGYNTLNMNPAQLRQMLASRGFVTEINGQLFKTPVASSFTLGLGNLDNCEKQVYEFSIETRSGAKALYFTVVGVEKSEYMARGIQLVSTILEKAVEGDCGSTDYINWYIRTPEENPNNDDLKNMDGMYHILDNGELELISKDSKHLYGKSVRLRHINKCKLTNSRHVCGICLGDIHYNLFRHNNVGFIGTTYTTQKTTQFIISTKHLTQSAKGIELKVVDDGSKYFVAKGNSYYLRANTTINPGTHTIIVEQHELQNLKELDNFNPEQNNPGRFSKLSKIYFEVNTRNTKEFLELKLKVGSSYGVFTKEMIRYIKEQGTKFDHLDRLVIDLAEWDKSKPIIYTPEVEYSFLDLAKKVKSMFDKMSPDETPESFLQKVYDTVNNKLSVNLSLISAMVYGFTVRDYEKKDFRLGRHSDNVTIKELDVIINSRSLGSGYGWEKLTTGLFNPRIFYGNNAVHVPLDSIVELNP